MNAFQGGVSTSFSTTFSAPDVKIAQAVVGPMLRWEVELLGVGFVSAGNPANPEEPSYAGYQWSFGAIFELPRGSDLNVRVHPRTEWIYGYTRVIINDHKTWEDEGVFTYEAG